MPRLNTDQRSVIGCIGTVLVGAVIVWLAGWILADIMLWVTH